MSTITLTCTNCQTGFEKDKNEYKRRLAKLPGCENFFCSRRCSSIHRNKQAGGNSNPSPPKPQYGNDYGQLYPTGTGWYISRCAQDRRVEKRLTEDRLQFADHIEHLWKEQNGKCALSGSRLQRRGPKGECKTANRFLIASLDRIDNNVGYTIGNVQWISVAMNLARGDTNLGQFKKHLKTFLKRAV